jgi:hypothetical protein
MEALIPILIKLLENAMPAVIDALNEGKITGKEIIDIGKALIGKATVSDSTTDPQTIDINVTININNPKPPDTDTEAEGR